MNSSWIRALVAVAAAMAGMAGCAGMDRPVTEERQVSESQTGSNIRRKDRSAEKVQSLGSDSVQQPLPPPFRPPTGGAP